MKSFKYYYNVAKVDIREFINPYLAPFRRFVIGKDNYPFTIISNNCWAGHVYRYYGLPYDSPTIGLYMFTEDYLKFVDNIKFYLSQPISFITYEQSRYKEELIKRGGDNIKCPIGVLSDIEIIFLHYKTENEAREKWNRRKERIHWNKLIVKMSEQNFCSEEQIIAFDNLPYKNKFIFVHQDYKVNSQILFKEFCNKNEVLNDTNNFRKYINLHKLIKSVR